MQNRRHSSLRSCLEPDFVPASLGFGSGMRRGVLLSRRREGERPRAEEVQSHFEVFWNLETKHRPIHFGENDSKQSWLDLGRRMLAVLCEAFDPATEVVAAEQPFSVPLVDQETGEVLDRDLVGSLDLLERDCDRRLVVVDLKTAARKYTHRRIYTPSDRGII